MLIRYSAGVHYADRATTRGTSSPVSPHSAADLACRADRRTRWARDRNHCVGAQRKLVVVGSHTCRCARRAAGNPLRPSPDHVVRDNQTLHWAGAETVLVIRTLVVGPGQ